MWRPSYGARGFFAPTTLGFRLEDVRPPVALHHGDIDALVALSMGRYVADHPPHATLRVFPGEGHQLIWPRWEELLRSSRATMPVQRLVNRLFGYGKLFATINALRAG